jgi:voltage-gated sodium channel
LRAVPVAAVLCFISFIILGTMIMLDLFIGIILSSMSEMHAEIADRNRAQHIAQTGEATPADNLAAAERQLAAAQEQLARLRHRLQRPASNVG